MCFEALLVGGGLKGFHWSQFLSQCLRKGFFYSMWIVLIQMTHVCVMGVLLIIFTDKCFLPMALGSWQAASKLRRSWWVQVFAYQFY